MLSMFRTMVGVVAGLVLFQAGVAFFTDGKSNAGTATELTVTIDQDDIPQYRALASELGLKYGYDYSTDEWWLDTLNQFEAWHPGSGDCGTWAEPKECEQQPGFHGLETLYCSHGRNAVDTCETRGESPFFETVYLTDHDVTLLTQLRREEPHDTYVTILKLAEGRHPDLHEN